MMSNAATAPPPAPEFQAVYRAWFPYVWQILRRLGVREAELEDAAQEVFLVVHRRLPEYDPERPIRPWLVGIAHRVALREHRRPRHARELFADDDELSRRAIDEETPEGQFSRAQRQARVHRALDTLDEDRRAVLVLHEFQGMPCPEIAEALELPVNTVYTRLRAARQMFRVAVSHLRLAGGEA